MSITASLVLPPDVIFIPAEDLSDEDRARCKCTEGAVVVTRPRSRTQSRVLNKEAAELLGLFKEEKTIVEAVLETIRTHGGDPETTLENIYATLRPFINACWLVPADSDEAYQITPWYDPGERIGRYVILGCRQVLEDTEVYVVRSPEGNQCALKIARPKCTAELRSAFDREATALKTINGPPAPTLIDTGELERRPYLVMSWCPGVSAAQAAAELRNGPTRRPLKDLCVSILHAYASLHDLGVLHGDVHPHNILVNATGAISIVDFGSSTCVKKPQLAFLRRAVYEYREPEYVAAALSGAPRPPVTPASEQYSLGALLYFLVVGRPYLRLSGEREPMLRAILDQDPLSFSQNGAAPWPELEEILARALQKTPDRRFDSVGQFTQALRNVQFTEVIGDVRPVQISPAIRSFISQLQPGSTLWAQGPTNTPFCSVTYGSAGIAYFHYCRACSEGDPKLLAWADAWLSKALHDIDHPFAFARNSLGFDGKLIRPASVYYGKAGVYLVRALIAHALGDDAGLARGIRDYVIVCGDEWDCADLVLGSAGILVGCAILMEVLNRTNCAAHNAELVRDLKLLGQKALSHVSQNLELIHSAPSRYLGISHGSAGMCYSALLWCEVTGGDLPRQIGATLGLLQGIAEEIGRGIRWPIKASGHDFMESWCHGAAGYVHLWTAAYRVLQEQNYLQIAERAAWAAWEASDSLGTLCCGYAGRAYALTTFFRHTGEHAWLTRARNLADHAMRTCERDGRFPHSLFKGVLGAILTIEDLGDPERMTFPLFDKQFRDTKTAR